MLPPTRPDSDGSRADSDHPFVEAWNTVQEAAHDNAVQKGFWEDVHEALSSSYALSSPERMDYLRNLVLSQKLMLIGDELSEAWEGHLMGNPSVKAAGFSAVEEELADVVIRMMDLCGYFGFCVAEEVIRAHLGEAGSSVDTEFSPLKGAWNAAASALSSAPLDARLDRLRFEISCAYEEILSNSLQAGFAERLERARFALSCAHEGVRSSNDDAVTTHLALLLVVLLSMGSEVDIIGALEAKMEYNGTRPYKHGRAF